MKRTALVTVLLFAAAAAARAAGPGGIRALSGVPEDLWRAAEPAAPGRPQASGPGEQKDWTIMVYLNGKNDLEGAALRDLNEMERAGSTKNVNIVVEIGRIKGFDASNGDWNGVRRYYALKDRNMKLVASRLEQDLGGADMGDYRTLIDFGRWAKNLYPAKRYMLIVWNHGSGWEKRAPSNPDIAPDKGISYDSATKNHINTPQLGLALSAIGKVAIYASDACLMQMPEVDYELKNYADYIIGSEETEPSGGYDYTAFLGALGERPAMLPAELAKLVVDSYSAQYRRSRTGSTLSIVRSGALDGLAERTAAWTSAVMAAGMRREVRDAINSAMSYDHWGNKDLYSLVELVSAKAPDAAVRGRSAELLRYISAELVLYNRTSDQAAVDDNGDEGGGVSPKKYSGSHGIAVYLPGLKINDGYQELAWASASGWPEFMAWYLNKQPPVIRQAAGPRL